MLPFLGEAIAGATGLAQTIGGLIGGGKARRQLKSLINNSPKVTENRAIADYYKAAQSRFQTSPENSTLYQMQKQNAGRGLAAGVSALSNRRALYGGVSSLTQGYNDALLKASAAAEQQKSQQFNQLGQAANMKYADDKYRFNTNSLMPYQNKMNMLYGQAAGANQTLNAGLTNLGNAGGLLSYRKSALGAGASGMGGI